MGQLEMEMCPSERCPSAPLHTNTVTSDRGVTSLLEINTRTAALQHRPAPAAGGDIILILIRGVSAAILNNETRKAKYWMQKNLA